MGVLKKKGQVSILVLMEGASEQLKKGLVNLAGDHVSILVLMEGASEHKKNLPAIFTLNRFNPCFNGRSFRTPLECFSFPLPTLVSILVLMEGASEQNLLLR